MDVDPGLAAANTAWVLAASALVLFMTPGLGFFYGGFTRQKNVLGDDHAELHRRRAGGDAVGGHRLQPGVRAQRGDWGLIGNLDYFGLKDVGQTPNESTRQPRACRSRRS